MRKSKFSDEQIVAILAQEGAGVSITELCRKHSVSRQTYQRWKSKFGGMGVLEVRRLKSLEDENRRLKQLVGDQALDIQALKAVIAKKL